MFCGFFFFFLSHDEVDVRNKTRRATERMRERDGRTGRYRSTGSGKVTPANFAVSGRAASRCSRCTCRGCREAPCVSGSGWRENGPLCVSSLTPRATKCFSAKGCEGDAVPFDKSTFGTPTLKFTSKSRRSEREREKVKLCSLVTAVDGGVVFVLVLLPQ